MQVVHLDPAARSDQVALGDLERHRRVLAHVVLVELHRRRLQAPPVAGTSVHLGEHLVERPNQEAAVVDQHDFVVLLEPMPADEVTREQRPRAEVVSRVRHRPGTPGDALELVELAAVEHPVGEVEDVRVPGQLAHVVDDVVIDHTVAVVGREQAGAARRLARLVLGRDPYLRRIGNGVQALVLPDEEVVQQRVHVFGRRVEVAAPVPPEVEVQAGGAQVAPPLVDEVEQRVDAAGGQPVRLDVPPLVEGAALPHHRHRAAQERATVRPLLLLLRGDGQPVDQRALDEAASAGRVGPISTLPAHDERAPALLEVGAPSPTGLEVRHAQTSGG